MTLTTDESALYAMSEQELLRHGRAVQQYCDAAQRSWVTFNVEVLGLPPDCRPQDAQAAAAAAGLRERSIELWRAIRTAEELQRAFSETLRRRGLGR